MRDDRGRDEGETGGNAEHADGMREPVGDRHFLDRHQHAERRHPHHVHDANREHDEHHRPAATEAEQTLFETEAEHAARRLTPKC